MRTYSRLCLLLLLVLLTCPVQAQLDLDLAKKKCTELGFKVGTERFGACVLQLSKPDDAKVITNTQQSESVAVPLVRPLCRGAFSLGVGSTWTNCVGEYVWPSGVKYVGEFKEGRFDGRGVEYSPDGTIRRSGRWSFGNHVGGN